jgi:hypothetical protein
VSERLRNGLWLFGRAHLSAAEFFMIYEYIVLELGGGQRLMNALGLPDGWITEFEHSVHTLHRRRAVGTIGRSAHRR